MAHKTAGDFYCREGIIRYTKSSRKTDQNMRSEEEFMGILNVMDVIQGSEDQIPDHMEPGTICSFKKSYQDLGAPNVRYAGILACPDCATIGLITTTQAVGYDSVICASDTCSCEVYIRREPESDDYRFDHRLPA